MKNYRFTKHDELLYETLYETSTTLDLSDRKNLLKSFEDFEIFMDKLTENELNPNDDKQVREYEKAFEDKIRNCTDEEFAELKRRTIEQEKIYTETKVDDMPDDYKFSLEDEITYRMFLELTTTVDVTTKEGIIYKINRIKTKFNREDLDKLIKKIKESTDEEFEVFKNRCLR